MMYDEMNNYGRFVNDLMDALQAAAVAAGTSVELIRKTVIKVNGSKDSISVKFPGCNVAPVIYPADFYERYAITGIPAKEQAEEVMSQLYKMHMDLPNITRNNFDRDYIRGNLFYKVVNREMNRELEKDGPCCAYVGDLLLVPYIGVDVGQYQGSIRFTNNMMAYARFTSQEIHAICMSQLDKQEFFCRSLDDILRETIEQLQMPDYGLEETQGNVNMYILSNSDKSYGAVAAASDNAMLLVQRTIGEKDFYLIPSSVHECLVVPSSFVDDPADLQRMCQNVNADESVVKREDVLSDNIYRYDGETMELMVCNSLSELRQQEEWKQERFNSEHSTICRRR